MAEKEEKKTAAKKGTTKKPVEKKVAAKKSVEKKVATKKDVAKKAAARKVVGKKATTKKPVEKKVVAKKEVTKKPVEKKVATKKEFVKEKINKNKTFFLKHQNVSKKWLVLDAKGKALGRVAAKAASLLRGKHKVDFTPNVDCGDNVIIINCKDMVLTGKKLEQKVRYRHSGWIGGLKTIKYSELMKNKPQKAMELAVKGMLPHNSLGAKMAKHLKTYKDSEHKQQAQTPELVEF